MYILCKSVYGRHVIVDIYRTHLQALAGNILFVFTRYIKFYTINTSDLFLSCSYTQFSILMYLCYALHICKIQVKILLIYSFSTLKLSCIMLFSVKMG